MPPVPLPHPIVCLLGVPFLPRLTSLIHSLPYSPSSPSPQPACSRSYQWTSSFSELLRGGALTLTSEDARHAVSYELGWRQLTDTTQLASHAVRQQLGHQLKSAVRYIGRYSTLDDPAYPTSGEELWLAVVVRTGGACLVGRKGAYVAG